MSDNKTVTVYKFVSKIYGKTLVATLGEERFSKNVTMEEKDILKKKIDAYNKRPSETLKKQIVKILTPEKIAAKEKAEKNVAVVKGLKQQIKKEVKKDKKEKQQTKNGSQPFDFMAEFEKAAQEEGNVEKLQLILNKYKKEEEKVVPTPTSQSYRRSGEH